MLEFQPMTAPAGLRRISYLYLLAPAILFFLGWLRPVLAVPLALAVLWVVRSLWFHGPGEKADITRSSVTAIIAVSGAWVLLSGVGGYTFQNWDHHWRNAVLHDLTSYGWPVVYSAPVKGPIQMLVYNIGYWLPAAAIGRLLGWHAANAALFFWNWLGAALVGLHLSARSGHWRSLLLLILFSGLDGIGVLLFSAESYPSLLPPITHLEAWAGGLQYSSFTTQLFWVFNQAIPAWLCIVLLMRERSDRFAALLWSICLFYAPLPAIGFAPLVAMEWFRRLDRRLGIRRGLLRSFGSAEGLAAMVLTAVSLLYFAANGAARQRAIELPEPGMWVAFVLLEGGLIWLLLLPLHRWDPRFYLVGFLLVALPALRLGSGNDLAMRASIPALFYLMVWTGDALAGRRPDPLTAGDSCDGQDGAPDLRREGPRAGNLAGVSRAVLTIALLLGSLTPLYEINRTLYRTAQYYFLPSVRASGPVERPEHLAPEVTPELEHPGRLEADALGSLAGLRDLLSRNFVGDVRRSVFYLYMADR